MRYRDDSTAIVRLGRGCALGLGLGQVETGFLLLFEGIQVDVIRGFVLGRTLLHLVELSSHNITHLMAPLCSTCSVTGIEKALPQQS